MAAMAIYVGMTKLGSYILVTDAFEVYIDEKLLFSKL